MISAANKVCMLPNVLISIYWILRYYTCKPANHDDGIICLVVTIWDVFLFISDAKWAFEVIKEHREPIQLGIQ